MVKVGFSPSRKVDFIYLDESPLKMIKNGFYFILRALFVHKYLDFCPDFFCQNDLIEELRLISRFITSQTEKLQYTHLPISQEVKTAKQLNLAS